MDYEKNFVYSFIGYLYYSSPVFRGAFFMYNVPRGTFCIFMAIST